MQNKFSSLYQNATRLIHPGTENNVLLQFINEFINAYESNELIDFDEIFNHLPFGIRIQTTDNKILKINKYYSRMVGIPVNEAPGMPCESFICPRVCNTGECAFKSIFKSGSILKQNFNLPDAKGQQRIYRYMAVPIFDADGKVKMGFELYMDVTDSVQLEKKLDENQNKYRTLVNSMKEGLVVQEQGGKISTCNKSAQKILGLTYNQLIGKTSMDPSWHIIHEDGTEFPGHEHPAMLTLKTGKGYENVIMGIHKPNSTLTWISVNTEPLFDDDKHEKPYAVIASFNDITDIKNNESRFTNYIESSPIDVFIVNTEGIIKYVNSSASVTTGYDYSRLNGMHLFELIAERHSTKIQKAFTDTIQLGKSETELFLKQHNGILRYVKFNATYLDRDTIIIFCTDITHNKKTENELRRYKTELEEMVRLKTKQVIENEERLQTTLRIANEGIWEWDLITDEVFFNPSYYTMIGYEPYEFKPSFKEWEERLHPEDREFANQLITNNIKLRNKQFEVEFRFRTKSGGYKWIKANGHAIAFDEAGIPVRYAGTHSDIHALKMTNIKLRKSEKMFRDLTEHINDWVWEVNTAGKYTYCSPQVFNILGYQANELLHKSMNDILMPSGKDEVTKTFNKHIKNQEPIESMTSVYQHKDGQPVYIESSGSPIFENNNIIGFRGINRNVTQRTEMEQKLFHAVIETEERERSRFAKDLHDGLGPQLSAIKLYIGSLLSDAYSQEQKLQMIENAKEICSKAITSTKEIANNLMPNLLQNFGLYEAINTFCDDLQALGIINIHLNNNEYTGTMNDGIKTSLYRILTELINNTIKHAHAENIAIQFKGKNNSVLVIYTDDGIGFDEDTLNHGKGSGLKNIIYRVKSINGDIQMQSDKKNGSRFVIHVGDG